MQKPFVKGPMEPGFYVVKERTWTDKECTWKVLCRRMLHKHDADLQCETHQELWETAADVDDPIRKKQTIARRKRKQHRFFVIEIK